jgi:hypothetical protein
MYLNPGAHELVTGADAMTTKALATAAIRITYPNSETPYATCGATWVSPHFAITAAHCVDSFHFMFVEEFDTRSLALQTVLGPQAEISGSWSTGWSNGEWLGPEHGYHSAVLTSCSVERIREDADLALIRCSDRSRRNYVRTTASEPAAGTAVDVWWFHEIYNLPTYDDGTERWSRYGRGAPRVGADINEPDGKENWHYLVWHQLFPLRTRGRDVLVQDWPFPIFQNQPFTIASVSTLTARTNLPVCHGTSGSGVFKAGTNTLLGPVSTGSGSGLCQRITSGWTNHVRATVTHEFVTGTKAVIADRG